MCCLRNTLRFFVNAHRYFPHPSSGKLFAAQSSQAGPLSIPKYSMLLSIHKPFATGSLKPLFQVPVGDPKLALTFSATPKCPINSRQTYCPFLLVAPHTSSPDSLRQVASDPCWLHVFDRNPSPLFRKNFKKRYISYLLAKKNSTEAPTI